MKELVIPKGETVWAGYYNPSDTLRFIVTTKGNSREYYYLYESVDGVFKKLGKAKSPKDLEKKFDVWKRV